MTVTALIAEDEPILAQALATMLRRLWPELKVLPIAEDGGRAVDMALSALPEVLFLDIQMPERNGLEVAELVAEQWPDDRPLPRIVFVTAYDEYAVAAFERAAVDYVLKPVQSARLAVTCDRLKAQMQHDPVPESAQSAAAPGMYSTTGAEASLLAALQALYGAQLAGPGAAAPAQPPLKVIQAAVGTGLQMVPVDEVLYFEAADKYVRVITASADPQAAELLIRTPLRELIPRLDADQFWQVHRSVVVNVKAIERISRTYGRLRVHIRGRSETLEVSRMYAHLFKAM
ncbi:MAG TPA: LytTR family DNA-binding domain-containing protein [Aquabacterium sp.]|nr:LytTR family DNA-binding domain-containing protein [Aquabacterium sp.]